MLLKAMQCGDAYAVLGNTPFCFELLLYTGPARCRHCLGTHTIHLADTIGKCDWDPHIEKHFPRSINNGIEFVLDQKLKSLSSLVGL